MYNLLVVDDEPRIRRGLAQAIPWEELDIRVAAEAADGSAALSEIDRSRIDLVLADIRMPGMDGIELLRALGASGRDLPVVVLSGYDDYEYVRSALRLGAHDYLLKPIDRDQLYKTFEELLQKEDERKLPIADGHDRLARVRERFLAKLLAGDLEATDIMEQAEILGVNLDAHVYRCGIAHSRQRDVTELIGLSDALSDGYAQSAAGAGNWCYFLPLQPPEITCLHCIGRTSWDRASRELQNVILASPQVDLYAVGPTVQSVGEVSASMRAARRLLRVRGFFNTRRLLDGTRPILRFAADEDSFRLNTRLATACDVRDADVFHDEIGRSLEAIVDERRTTELEKRCRILKLVSRCQERLSEFVPGRALNAESASINELVNEVTAMASRVMRETETPGRRRPTSLAAAVKRRAETDYSDPALSLKTLASEFALTPAYLGRIFHETTGCYFTEYLTELRIDRAKTLLRDHSASVTAVAVKVGFPNADYFGTRFKQLCGMTPGAYRSSQLSKPS